MTTGAVHTLDGTAAGTTATPGSGRHRLCETTRSPDSMQPVLSIRAKVPEAAVAVFAGDALARIRLYMRERELVPAAPPFVMARPSSEWGVVDAEAGWPTARLVAGGGSIHAGTVPRGWLVSERAVGGRDVTFAGGWRLPRR